MFNYIQSCIFINTEWCLVRIKNSPPFTYMSCSLSVKNRVSFCFPNKLYTVPFPVNARYPHFKQLRLCYVKMIHSFTKVNSLNIISMKFSTKRTTYYRLKNLNKFVEKTGNCCGSEFIEITSGARQSENVSITRKHTSL